MGLGLRSSDVEEFLVDEEAINVAVDNHKRLSRYHWEDIIKLEEGQPLILFLLKSEFTEMFDGYFSTWKSQHKSKRGGNEIRIAGQPYIVIRASIKVATLLHEIKTGQHSINRFKTLFGKKYGFSLSCERSYKGLAIQWLQLIEHAQYFLLFGPPLDGTRKYSEIFRKKAGRGSLKLRVLAHLTWDIGWLLLLQCPCIGISGSYQGIRRRQIHLTSV